MKKTKKAKVEMSIVSHDGQTHRVANNKTGPTFSDWFKELFKLTKDNEYGYDMDMKRAINAYKRTAATNTQSAKDFNAVCEHEARIEYEKTLPVFDVSEERVKEVLWRRFKETLTLIHAEEDEIDHDEVNKPMHVVGQEFDVIAELSGDSELGADIFYEVFRKEHGSLELTPTILGVRLTATDKSKIIEEVKKSCLSTAAKEDLLRGLGVK